MIKIRHFTIAVILILPALIGVRSSRAQTPNQVGIMVQFGDGSIQTTCVTFDEQTITGFDALQRAGFGVDAAFDPYQGSAVCQINGEGCPADNCFCSMPNYWTYWHLSGEWIYSGAGSSNTTLSHGNVDGWKWGQGDPPPVVAFDQICTLAPTQSPPTLPSPTNEAPTATPTPLPTDLPPSSGVVLPTATPINLPAPSPTSPAPVASTPQTGIEPSPTLTPGTTIEPGLSTAMPATVTPTSKSTTELATPVNTLTPSRQLVSLSSPSPTPPSPETPQLSETLDSTASTIKSSAGGYAIFGIIAAGLGLFLLGWALRMRGQ